MNIMKTKETREEAIAFLQGRIDLIDKCYPQIEDYREALDMAIKALEQDSILDKIRTEMLEEMLSHSGTGEEVIQAYADGLNKGLQIIDKYKEESEVVKNEE